MDHHHYNDGSRRYNHLLPPPPPPPNSIEFHSPLHPYHHRHGTFVNSPLHPYHHRHAIIVDSPLHHHHPPPPPDLGFIDNRRFDYPEPPPPPPPRVSSLPPILLRQVDFHDYLSPPPPPQFFDRVDRFSNDFHGSRFRDEFSVDSRHQLHWLDENPRRFDNGELPPLRVYDERRHMDVVERDTIYDDRTSSHWRNRDVVRRDELRPNLVHDGWRGMTDFEREELLQLRIDAQMRIRDDLERKELLRQRNIVARDELLSHQIDSDRRMLNNGLHHDSYHSEALFRDSEWVLDSRGYGRNEVSDKRGLIKDENELVNNSGRYSGFGARPNASRSPTRFQAIDIEVDKRFPQLYEERMNHGLYDGGGGSRVRERLREYSQECDEHTYSPGKKSAFLRLQPAIQDISGSKNRFDKSTSSPQKSKKISAEIVEQRSREDQFGSTLDLDVSFKSNILIAKAVARTPLSSGMDVDENLGVNDLDTTLVRDSPSKAGHSRNRGDNSPVPKKKEKEVRISPILMKVGIRKVAEVPDNSPKPSSGRCDSPSGGGSTYKASPEGKAVSKDDNRDGVCKVSPPSNRRKRKAVNLISCLSASVATNSDTGVDVDKSLSSPSVGSMSDAPGSLEPGCVQDEAQISNLDHDVANSIEKCSSDIDTKKGVGQHLESTSVLVGRGNVEGSPEPLVVSVGNNIGNINLCCRHEDSNDSLAETNSITCEVGPSIMTENRACSANYNCNVHEPRELSPDCYIHYRNVNMDGDDTEADLRHSGGEMKLAYSQSIDVSHNEIPSTDCIAITAVSGIEVTNDIQEQHCTGAGTILVNADFGKRRKLSSKAFAPMGGDLGPLDLPSIKEYIVSPDKKRNFGIQACDVDPKVYPHNFGKEMKTIPFDSVFSVSESCDIYSSANVSNSIANGPLSSVNDSEQAVGGFEKSNVLPISEDVVGEATNTLPTAIRFLGDCSKAKVQQKDSHSSVEQMAESECRGDDGDLIGVKDELIESMSEVELADKYQNSGRHCIKPNHGVSLNDGPIITEMECESNVAAKGDLATLPDCPILCTEPTEEIVTTKSVTLDRLSKVNSLVGSSPITPTFDISTEAIDTALDIICGPAKKSDSSMPVGALISQSNLLHRGFPKNVYFGHSAASSNRSFTQKAASLPSKRANEAITISNSTRRQFSWRNENPHGKTTLPSQTPVTVFPKKNLVTSAAKPRTWHRTDNLAASNTVMKKPAPSMTAPQRPPYGNFLNVHNTSYIRKGNSIVRNQPLSTALGPCALSTSSIHEKPNDIKKNEKLKGSGSANSFKSPDRLITGGQRRPIEMPKIPSSTCSENTSECNIAITENCTSPFQLEQYQGMDNKVAPNATETALSISGNPEIALGRNLKDDGNFSDGVLQASSVKRVVYIKRKANQLIATSTPPELAGRDGDKKLGLSSDNSYYKRRKNQLIRASSESNIQNMVNTADDNSNSQTQKANVYSGRSASKGLSRRVKSSKASLVWKLGDAKSSDKSSEPMRSRQLLSHLLPWKRTTYRRSVWRPSASSSSSSLIKNRKSLTSRNQAVLYVRSGRGFSLKRSKVISLAGSLKWSKSMEKRSKKFDEEATLAAALLDSTARHKACASDARSEAAFGKLSSHKSAHGLKLNPGERIYRVGLFKYRMDPSRRTLQRIPDEEALDATTSKTEKYARKSYMPKRLLIGSNEYVRIGNGNQLVRDPKRRTRMLASEKVRWSLHTARSRLAKKRKFCQFFTRFGRCNKSEGKCPYIHDASKIAVCTKFLKGLCTDPKCKLTHKVIPDRMPDCSFFLQGLCSNETCPYRHVNVDSKASICENFSRGYCAEGNECQKKHSYLCPEFEATGSCPQGSNCKLYHPKKCSVKKGKLSEDQRNIRGRYFDPGLTATVSKPESETAVLEKDVARKNSGVVPEGGDMGDFISLDVSDDEEAGETIYPNCEVTESSQFVASDICLHTRGDLGDFSLNGEVTYLSEFDVLGFPSDNVDELAKPPCILDMQ